MVLVWQITDPTSETGYYGLSAEGAKCFPGINGMPDAPGEIGKDEVKGEFGSPGPSGMHIVFTTLSSMTIALVQYSTGLDSLRKGLLSTAMNIIKGIQVMLNLMIQQTLVQTLTLMLM